MLLATYRISNPSEVREIMDAAKNKHYHVACTRVFELTHKEQGVKKGEGCVSLYSLSLLQKLGLMRQQNWWRRERDPS